MDPQSKESLAKRLEIDPAKLEECPAKINRLEECPPGFPARSFSSGGMELSKMLLGKMQITPWTTHKKTQLVTYVTGPVTLFLWDWDRVYEYELGYDSTEGEEHQIFIPAGIQHCFISQGDSVLTTVVVD
jgi:predicted cupin superfamily sugar epimerase